MLRIISFFLSFIFICPIYNSTVENAVYSNADPKFQVDCVIFSYDRPLQLWALLESAEKYLAGVNQTYIIYRSSNEEFEEAYRIVKNRFSYVHFKRQGNQPREDFKPLTLECSFSSSTAEYIMFGVDDIIVTDYADLTECTQALEKNQAYGFYLRLGKNINYCYALNKPTLPPSFVSTQTGHFLWKFCSANGGDWSYPNSVDMTIFKKDVIKRTLRSLKFKNPNNLEYAWSRKAHLSRCGLCFERSKIVNLPLNLVHSSDNRSAMSYSTAELLQKFKEGYKIDISAFFRCNNNSPHMDYPLSFIPR